MPVFEAVKLALSQIRVQKLKSFFTLLGVTISVMFLIAVVSIVEGMGRYVEEDFAAKFLGVNTFNLRRFPDINTDVTEAEWRAWMRRPVIKPEDDLAVREALPPEAKWALHDIRWIDASSPYRNGGAQVIAQAVTPDFFSIKDLIVAKGRAHNELDEQLGTPVVVIGHEIAEHYFPNLDPIGRELQDRRHPVPGDRHSGEAGLRLRDEPRPPGDRAVQFADVDDHARPRESRRRGRAGAEDRIAREHQGDRPRGHAAAAQASSGRTGRLRVRDVAVRSKAWMNIKKFLVIAGIALPAIGLVVGAIVIMNIMLVAVAERTREIGIRKSIGARRRDILAQFLVESATLSVLGAILGVALGIGLSQAIAAVSPLPATVAPWSVALAVAIGAGVGIIAGVYPASRAARLDPIHAMRMET